MITNGSLDLPEPSIAYLKHLKTAKVSERLDAPALRQAAPSSTKAENKGVDTPTKSRQLRKDSLEDVDADPWASPALHKSHTHAVSNDATPKTNGTTAVRPVASGGLGASRTTSAFTTHSEGLNSTSGEVLGTTPSGNETSGPTSTGWGSYDNTSSEFPTSNQPDQGAVGFGSGGDDPDGPSTRPTRALGGGRTTSRGVEEMFTITMLPEKEGMFMFQHRNYEVKSVRRASSVVRRYSDFVWLLDCLFKRYPFRQLPLLPPKRVAGMWLFLSGAITEN